MDQRPDISLIIACYNEAEYLEKNMRQIENILAQTSYSYEFILIDDASRDKTAEIIEKIAKDRENFSAFFHKQNVGRGGTVREGLLNAKGIYAGFLDIDLEISPLYLIPLIMALKEGADVATVKRVYKWHFTLNFLIRAIFSITYKKIAKMVLNLPYADTESGFKFFNKEKTSALIAQSKNDGWFWDTEIMATAYYGNLKVKEIPGLFVKDNSKKSTVKIFADSLKYLIALFNFKKQREDKNIKPKFSLSFGMIKNFLKNHGLAILLAFLIGVIVVSPQILLRLELKEEYQGIALAGSDGEEYYSLRIQEAYDGHYKISSPELYEYKNKPYTLPSLPETTIALLAKIFNLSAKQMVIWDKFIFPFLLYLVLYSLTLAITENKKLALVAPTIIILATNFIFNPNEIFYFLTFRFKEITGPIDYYRPIHPQFSSLFFFLWFLIFYKWLKNQNFLLFIFSTILLGLMFYSYLYSWILAYGLIGGLTIFSFLNKKINLKIPTKKLIIMLGLSLIISLPYWLNFYQTINDPLYELLQKRFGFFESHHPLWSNLLFLDFIILFLLFWKKEKNLNFYFFLSLLLTLGLVINQQIITGVRFYPGHWHWYYTAPFSVFLALWYLYSLMGKNKKITIILSLLLLIIGLADGLVRQNNTYQTAKQQAITEQRYKAVYDWFNLNTNKDDVVLADGDLNVKFAAYTHNNIYLSNYSEIYLTPTERFENKLLTRMYLKNLTKENINQYLIAGNKDILDLLFGIYRQRKEGCGRECFNQEELDGLKEKYFEFASNVDFKKFLKAYRLDYAAWDTQIDPDWHLDQYAFMKIITEINGIKIYKVIL